MPVPPNQNYHGGVSMQTGNFNAGCRMPDAGCRMPDAGCRMPDAGKIMTFSE